MPAFAAQYQFAASFTVFLVALAGLALVILREALTTRAGARLALGAGFVGIGTGAFLAGSLIVPDQADPALLALRVAGVGALIVGSVAWRGSPVSRTLLQSGAVGLLLAVPLEALDQPNAAAAVAAVGGLLVGAALIAASRVAIAARVAASAAATLLLVVLVLSVALSAVLGRTVENQALTELDGRAVIEVGAVEAQARNVLDKAAVAASLLAALREDRDDATSAPVLSSIDPDRGPTDVQRAALQAELDRVRRDVFRDVAFAFVSPDRKVVAASGDAGILDAAAASPVVEQTLRLTPRKGRLATPVLEGRALIVAARPLDLESGGGNIGAIVGVTAIDDRYLDVRVGDGAADSLAVVAAGGVVVARSGPLPPASVLGDLADGVLGPRSRARAVTDERYAAARAVRNPTGDGPPVLAVISSRSTNRVEAVREALFRTFFVIAFGGTVLALLLAAVVGDRIGAGIRRLTSSAEAIQRGELGVRSGVRSEDEVGVLGATFDSMAASIEQQTDALQEAADRVEAIVAGMGEALIALDAKGCVTDFNQAAEDLLELAGAEARGHPIDQVLTLTAEDGVDLTARVRSLEPGRWSALGDVCTEGGTAVPVAVTAGALRGPEGEVAGGVIVLRDLRGEREVERMKRHFLSRVGHELRTPLTPLIGYSQLLAGRDLPAERARPVYASILSSAKRLERIVEMLEFFASLDAGRQVLRAEPVDVREVLASVVERRSAALAGSSHTLVKRVARDTPRVNVDGRWLERSIDELVDNAVKFSPSGGRVQVTAGLVEGDPSTVEIAVRDSGVGMSPSEVEAAFLEWTQGDESDTRHFGGLGLGLALVQRVAEHHGGRVVCATAPGKGARFSILLPALEEAPPITRRRGSRAVTSGRDRPRRTDGR
jgi:two-component system sensor histidine kinase VicK